MPTLSAKRLRKNYADLFPVFPIFRIYLIISKYLKKYNLMFFSILSLPTEKSWQQM